MAKHALLSPSSAARWTSCPPSARLCEHIEEGPSLFAEEGTEAHALCEFKVRLALALPAQDPIPTLGFYNEQMEDCANEYTAFVIEALQQEKRSPMPAWSSGRSTLRSNASAFLAIWDCPPARTWIQPLGDARWYGRLTWGCPCRSWASVRC